jgi:hypothetical protein
MKGGIRLLLLLIIIFFGPPLWALYNLPFAVFVVFTIIYGLGMNAIMKRTIGRRGRD